MGQVGPRNNLHAPTVVAVQPAPHDRHHDEAAAPLACLPIVHKLGRKASSGALGIAPLIPIKVFL
jgi:hypothetical protein